MSMLQAVREGRLFEFLVQHPEFQAT